jgi:3-oxoacyl-[acyl-carrier protein] reductase
MAPADRTGAELFTSFTGISVVVTGGSRGIGRGIAAVFARAGASVTVAGRDERALAAVAADLGALAVAADVSRPQECHRLAEAAAARYGGIDVLCANAGIYPRAALSRLTEPEFDEVFDVNVKGTVFAVQACLPALIRSGRGRVIVTSSITGPVTGLPAWSHYGASKAAQLGFVRAAAVELARHGITVNAVLPGSVASRAVADLDEEQLSRLRAAIPLGRLGSPEDIGYTCLFLASVEAGYITGQAIAVDGGQVLPEAPGDEGAGEVADAAPL